MGKVPALTQEWGEEAIGVMWRLKKQLVCKQIASLLEGFAACLDHEQHSQIRRKEACLHPMQTRKIACRSIRKP